MSDIVYAIGDSRKFQQAEDGLRQVAFGSARHESWSSFSVEAYRYRLRGQTNNSA
jgi:hypothetical protein